MTQFFYSDHIFEETIILPEDEAHHALKVLRKHQGDTIITVDGKGGWYETIIENEKIQNCKNCNGRQHTTCIESSVRLDLNVIQTALLMN